jgi:hypothetical protein
VAVAVAVAVAAAAVNRGVKAEAGEEVKAMEATRATEAMPATVRMQICPQALPRYGNAQPKALVSRPPVFFAHWLRLACPEEYGLQK